MKKTTIILVFILITILNVFSQEKSTIKRTCGTKVPTAEWKMNFSKKLQSAALIKQTQRTNASYTLPIIVHVVYWDVADNISAAQVNSQLPVLNADYAGTGFNSGNCPPAFSSLKANTNITFCAATKSPNGTNLAEPGIHRINAQTAGFDNPGANGWSDTYIDQVIKPATNWDPTKYLNIWVMPLAGGLLGYATFPGGPADEDGVVILNTAFGTTGIATAPYNKGRTTTHEIGHWLGLYHISGDEACGDDEVGDTPEQLGGNNDGENGLNYGCPTFPFQVNGCGAGTSPNGEMFMNFMDYVDDVCMYMFTNGQSSRIQDVITAFTMREQLTTSNVCSSTPAIPVANFTADKTAICPSTTVNFTDLSTNTPTSWLWTISPNSGYSFTGGTNANSQHPKIIFNNTGNYTISLKATNSMGNDTETKTNYISVSIPSGLSLPFLENFQNATFPPSGWSLVTRSGFNWERTTAAGGFGLSSASMYFNNHTNNANKLVDDIVSPVINLNGATNPRLKFDVAYARYSNSSVDSLTILISTACSPTTQILYKKGGAELATAPNTNTSFVPSSTQWGKDSINIPSAFLNQKVYFTFKNNGAWGNNIYVDNINVYNAITVSCTGSPTANFTASAAAICAGSSITFTNTSTASVGAVDSVRWTINGGTTTTSTSTTTVNSTFNTPGVFTIILKAYKCGTVSTKNISITVHPIPAKPVITQVLDSLYLTPIVSGANYDWYKNGGFLTTTSLPKLKITENGIYTVKTSNLGCTSTVSSNFNAVLTSLHFKKLNIEYAIVPNPNNGTFELNISSKQNKTYLLKIYTINGQVLLEDELRLKMGLNNKIIQLQNIENGMYFLSIIGEEGVSTQSILIQ